MDSTAGCALCDSDHRRGSEDCPASRVGKVVAGKYRLDRLMGVGGMGAVYAATHATLGTQVAIKMIHARFASNEKIAKRFDQEARRVAALSHPGIVQVSDLGRDSDGSPYLEMELLDGTPVDALLKDGPLSLEKAADIVGQALEALEYAHGQGIVHRDLKPENLFMVGDQVKILDFGIAKAMEEADAAGMTQTGSVMGTPVYMSPEQLTDAKRVDARTDIYAMGATLYELLTASHTVSGNTYPELISKVLQGQVDRAPRVKRPELPAIIDDVVAKALAKEPDERYSSAATMREALRTAVDEPASERAKVSTKSEEGKATPPLVAEPAESAGSKMPFVVGGVAVAAVAGAAVFMLGGKKEGPPAVAEASDAALVVEATVDAAQEPPAETAEGMALHPDADFEMGSSVEDLKAAMALCKQIDALPCPEELYRRELPKRSVHQSAFYLDKSEVTADAFARQLNASKPAEIESLLSLAEGSPLSFDESTQSYSVRPGRENTPMVMVTWEGAYWFCEEQGKRLPTEAEWELAARGPEGRTFPWGNEAAIEGCSAVYYGRNDGLPCAEEERLPQPVASASQDVTPLGVHDLAGNVSEWVVDAFKDGYDPDCAKDCSYTAPVAAEVKRVARGGYLEGWSESLRGAGRSRFEHGAVYANLGFRCAKDGE